MQTGGLHALGLAIVALAVGGEKAIDEVHAVVVSDGANAGHPGKRQWADQLAQRQFPVEVVELGLCSRAREYGVERLPVLVDDSGPQRSGCVSIIGFVLLLHFCARSIRMEFD